MQQQQQLPFDSLDDEALKKMRARLTWMGTLSGEATHFYFCLPFQWGCQLWKEMICSLRIKFFPLNAWVHLYLFLPFNGRQFSWLPACLPGPGCSKLTTPLVNVSLKFQKLISQICQYFLLKKCEKLLHCKSFSHFFNKKFQCFWL